MSHPEEGRDGPAARGRGHPGKILDLAMLCLVGGQERTAAEYEELLGRAGFRLERVVPTNSPVSVVEAVPDAAG